MSKVRLEMSVSLDGFVTGPDVGPDEPMGRGGEQLHDWMFAGRSATEVEEFMRARFSEIGAVIVGRRMADLGIGAWGDEPAFHAPCFVITHRPAEKIVKKGGTSYVFVTDGIEAALEQARAAAGSRDVQVAGGANVARQYLNARLIDEVRLALVPVILGSGARLFEGVEGDVRFVAHGAESHPGVTHLGYDTITSTSS
jgi:dihydrofolate reductase